MDKNNRFILRIFVWAAMFALVLGMTAYAEELPGGGNAVDGTLREVETEEVTKGAEVLHAPDIPDDSEEESGEEVGPGFPEKEEEPEVVVPAGPHKGQSLGFFTTTGYCGCSICSGGFGLTYAGTVPAAHHTVAADLSLFPLGTRLMINDEIYTVEDMGSGVNGRIIDIYYDSHAAAVGHGTKYDQEVFAVVD